MAVFLVGLSAGLLAAPDLESHAPSQTAADLFREAAGTDMAFLAAGLVRSNFDAKDLATLMRYPSDELAVVKLKGSQVRAAFERSVALFPSPTDCFLQISNAEVSFSKSGDPDKRVKSIAVAGQKLDENKDYTVAMPMTLARGGLGYFKVWDKNQITKTVSGVTLEQILSGKAAVDSAPRWKSVP